MRHTVMRKVGVSSTPATGLHCGVQWVSVASHHVILLLHHTHTPHVHKYVNSVMALVFGASELYIIATGGFNVLNQVCSP